MSVKNLPGHFSGMKFPHTAEQLKAFGPSWYTDAWALSIHLKRL